MNLRWVRTCRADRAGLWPRLDWMFFTRGDLKKQTSASLNDQCKWKRCSQMRTYPVIFCGRLFWNSSSSTVQTAPFTFSTRTKHLWRLRLWRTAFWDCRRNEQTDPGHRKSIKTDISSESFQLPSTLPHCVWNTRMFEWTSCRFHLVLAAFLETPKWPIY